MSNEIILPDSFKGIGNAQYGNFDKEWGHQFTFPEKQFFPLWFEQHPMYMKPDQKAPIKYLFPFEPMIDISGKHVITKRYIAKPPKGFIGSIKERWNQDDYEIRIIGSVFGKEMIGGNPKPADCFPRKDMGMLRDWFQEYPLVVVHCELFRILGICQIVVESIDFPFVKGENVMAYEIKAHSNWDHQLLFKRTEGKLEPSDISVLGIIPDEDL